MDDLLKAYKAAVDAGALTIMPSYNSINGIRLHAYGEEMDRVKLPVSQGGMGFKGFVVSDWNAVVYGDIMPTDTSRYPARYDVVFPANNAEHRTVYCVLSGIDMIMATGGPSAEDAVTYLRNAHYAVPTRLPIERIDDAVRRILYVKKELGLFDAKRQYTTVVPVIGNQINSSASRARTREMVSESLVLLKNKDTILNKMNTFKHILVVGAAHEVGTQMGGWSISWQGSISSSEHIGTSIIQGILEVLHTNNMVSGTALPSNTSTYTNAGGTVYVTYADTFDNIPSGFTNSAIPPFDVVIGVVAETPY
jgi:beta-glucosidase